MPLDRCPYCSAPLRRLSARQTEHYRLPFAAAEWRLVGQRVAGLRCECCALLILLPAGRPRAEGCPRCERPSLRLERAELAPPSHIAPGWERIAFGCPCGYREVLEEVRPIPRLPEPAEGCLGTASTRGTGFGLDY